MDINVTDIAGMHGCGETRMRAPISSQFLK